MIYFFCKISIKHKYIIKEKNYGNGIFIITVKHIHTVKTHYWEYFRGISSFHIVQYYLTFFL